MQAGFAFDPDLCIMNYYTAESRLGVHQDKDESPASIEAGIPIVSISLGDAARFVIGGLTRKEPTRPMILRSGDVVVMGGPSRLRFHGVTRILPGTAPEGTGPGRFNLTFRKY
jgi:DNA alkylation damage repair protein AlkB